MKNILKTATSILLVCIMCLSLVSTVFAADKITHTSPQYGGGAATVFYVQATKDTKTAKVEYYGTAGRLAKNNGTYGLGKYGYFEVLIYGKNSKGKWEQISKTNLKEKASKTLSMKGYKEYKVRVYSWKTSTIGSYIGKNNYDSSAYWVYTPSANFKPGSNVKKITK